MSKDVLSGTCAMDDLKTKIKYWVKTVFEFILNPRLLLCLGLAWIITNGWAYITVAIAAWLDIKWLAAVAGGYLTALWIPLTPEKIITVIIAIFLLKLLFPKDKKTLEKLHDMKQKIKDTSKKIKTRHKEKKSSKTK